MAGHWELDKSDVARIMAQLADLYAVLGVKAEEAAWRAAEIVAPSVARKIPWGPAEGGHLKLTVKAIGPEVRMGGTRFEYTGWLEYGGRVGKDHKVHRTYIPFGRYLNPSYLEHYIQIDHAMSQKLTEACHDAGFEVD
jgi:hypothetical protein